MSFNQRLQEVLDQRQKQQLYRQRKTLQSTQGPEVLVEGHSFLNFSSNDYLGLAGHPEITAAFKTAANQFGVGSGASHLVCGHSSPHHQLEEALAEFTGRPRALLFSSGYMANIGTLCALLKKGDHVFEDRLNHASLLDGGLFSGARFQRFGHNEADSLDEKLSKAGDEGEKLVVVDGVFSMDGDIAPLPELVAACQKHNAWLMVDDAHGLGLLGHSGVGTVEHFELSVEQVPVLMGTLGKSLGTAGAFVAGSEELIEGLIQLARTYIYTTALPPAVAAATLTSLSIINREPQRRSHLMALIKYFRQGAQQLGLNLMASETAIQPLMIGPSGRAVEVSESLANMGFLVGAIRPPTVPANTARLRITLSAAHTQRQLDQLLEALGSLAL